MKMCLRILTLLLLATFVVEGSIAAANTIAMNTNMMTMGGDETGHVPGCKDCPDSDGTVSSCSQLCSMPPLMPTEAHGILINEGTHQAAFTAQRRIDGRANPPELDPPRTSS